jgi:hypothetical protein
MREKRLDIDVAFCKPTVFLTRVMNDRDQAKAVLANIEDHVAVDGIGVGKSLTDIQKTLPTCIDCDLVPSPDLFASVWVQISAWSRCFRVTTWGL